MFREFRQLNVRRLGCNFIHLVYFTNMYMVGWRSAWPGRAKGCIPAITFKKSFTFSFHFFLSSILIPIYTYWVDSPPMWLNDLRIRTHVVYIFISRTRSVVFFFLLYFFCGQCLQNCVRSTMCNPLPLQRSSTTERESGKTRCMGKGAEGRWKRCGVLRVKSCRRRGPQGGDTRSVVGGLWYPQQGHNSSICLWWSIIIR